jgi:hypothetical protein
MASDAHKPKSMGGVSLSGILTKNTANTVELPKFKRHHGPEQRRGGIR